MKKKEDWKDAVHGWQDISKVYIPGTMHLNKKYTKIMNNLSPKFYASLYQALVEQFPVVSKKSFHDGEDDWFGGTAGWYDALEKVLDKKTLKRMYGDLEWYDSDFLDGEIENGLTQWYNENILKHKVKPIKGTLDISTKESKKIRKEVSKKPTKKTIKKLDKKLKQTKKVFKDEYEDAFTRPNIVLDEKASIKLLEDLNKSNMLTTEEKELLEALKQNKKKKKK